MRKKLVALLALVLLAAYYLMGTGYLKQHRGQGSLETQVAATQQVLAQVPARPAGLDQQLQDALAGLAAAADALPEQLNTTRTLDAILRLAEDNGVRAVPLVTQPWTTEAHSGFDYSVFRLDLTITGDFDRVSAFLAQLETGSLPTLVVEYLQIAREEGTDTVAPVQAGVRVAIYARPTQKP